MFRSRPRNRLLIAALTLFSLSMVQADPVDFSRQTIDGKTFTLSDHRGKWVIINFWATWCGPCLRELPQLARFHRQHADNNAIVVGANFEEISPQDLKPFVDKLDLPFANFQVGAIPLVPFEPLERGLPETFFVNPDGEYVDKHIGELNYNDLLDYTGLED